MKKTTLKLGLIFGLLFAALVALGAKIGDDTLRIGTKTGADIQVQMGEGRLKWDQATSKLQFSNDSGASLKEIGSGGGAGSGINLLENADFESGSPPANWTASGGTFIAETGSPGFDGQSGSFDAGAAAQNLDSDFKAVPAGLENRSCNITIQYKYAAGASGDYKLQVVANTAGLLAEKDLNVTTDWRKDALQFTCPSSDSIKVRVTSTLDGGIILLDNASLGKSDFVDVAQAELTAYASYPVQSACAGWQANTGGFVALATDADCLAISVHSSTQTVNTADDDTANIVFDSLLPGKYLVQATFNINVAAASQHAEYRLSDGTIDGPICSWKNGTADTTNAQKQITCSMAVDYTTTAARTFFFKARVNTNDTRIKNDNDGQELTFTVTRYPLASAEAITLETSDYWAKGRIGGGNVGLSLGNVNEYVANAIGVTTLTLSNKEGHASVRIACGGGSTPAEGDTCDGAAVAEILGISFIPDTLGRYKICIGFPHVSDVSAAGRSITSFKMIEVADGTSTIIRESNAGRRLDNYGSASSVLKGSTAEICEEFEISSVTRKNFQISYTHNASGTISTNSVFMDNGAATDRARHGYYSIEKMGEQKPTPAFTDLTDSLAKKAAALGNYAGPPIVKALTCSTAASPSIAADPYNDGASVATSGGAGTCQWTFGTVFNTTPVCVAQLTGSTGNRNCTTATVNTTGVSMRTRDPSTGALDVQACSVICFGK